MLQEEVLKTEFSRLHLGLLFRSPGPAKAHLCRRIETEEEALEKRYRDFERILRDMLQSGQLAEHLTWHQ